MSTLLQDKTFLHDCAALSQREIESKYAGNGHSRDELRELYKQGRETALQTLSESLTAREERPGYASFAAFLGDEAAAETVKPVDEPVDGFSQLRISDESARDTLILMDATPQEAKRLEKLAFQQSGNLFETLREIHNRKAFLHLGATTFGEWWKRFSKETSHVFDLSTFYRKLAHKEVKSILYSAGVDARNLTQQEAAVLNKFPENVIPAVYRRAQELSDDDPPKGKGGEFHHSGKVYLDKLEQAANEIADEATGIEERDPFEPEPEPVKKGKRDFFDAANRAKPLPPQEATTPLPEDTDQREMADYEYAQSDDKSTVVFVGFSFEDGREGEVWVPKKVLTGILSGVIR